MDGLAQFKQIQREGWKNFAPLETVTTPAAARLAHFAGISKGTRVLDVGCGTGVVAITAARMGARVHAFDLTPELLERARENASIAQVEIEFREADVEELPYQDGEFDVVVSQFAHMFAPRPEVAVAQMLRVLRSGGTIAFSTWPPEMLVGRTSQLALRYVPPPPPGVGSPIAWGDPQIVVQRLGNAVTDLVFERDRILVPTLSPQHFRLMVERSAGPVTKMVQTLSATQPERLEAYRAEFEAIVSQYTRDNLVQQDYLLTRARKL
ncbi:MAG TPA: class I SAM-dependent methyltransferase [Candidatus Dormibacteraeota bacterium]|nr:class I SAM-dependent methyltransferase [Candidatus Dormibacteraeota bacterium]